VKENGFAQSYRSLSGSEADRVHLEIAAARARQFAESGAAILLYEIGGTSFDSTQFSRVATLAEATFQTLMISNAQQPDRASWRLVEIRRAHPNDKSFFFESPLSTTPPRTQAYYTPTFQERRASVRRAVLRSGNTVGRWRLSTCPVPCGPCDGDLVRYWHKTADP
jgi:hypothetical protein